MIRRFKNLDTVIGQGPFGAPTVFNFYHFEYQPARFVEKGLVAPEFQIFTPPWAVRRGAAGLHVARHWRGREKALGGAGRSPLGGGPLPAKVSRSSMARWKPSAKVIGAPTAPV